MVSIKHKVTIKTKTAQEETPAAVESPVVTLKRKQPEVAKEPTKVAAPAPAPEPEKNPEGGQGEPQKKVSVEGDDDEDSVERRVKKLMKLSVKGAKILGKFVKKSGVKGYGLAKKYGKITYKNTTKYVKDHVPYLNKNKDNKDGKDNQNQ